MEKYKNTKEAEIYKAKLKRADDLYQYSIKNPAWEDVAWDAEEDVAIYAMQHEDKIFN